MKFNKEDLGLYLSLSLVGAGLGLLVGAILANRVRKFEGFEVEEEEELGEPLVWGHPDFKKPVSKPKKTEKKVEEEEERSLTEAQRSFLKEHPPTQVQMQMYNTGQVDFEDLKTAILEVEYAKKREPYDYSKTYSGSDEDKPDLSDLVDLPDDYPDGEDVIDDRYRISQHAPDDKESKNSRSIYYDSVEDRTYTMTRRRQPIPALATEFISEETWYVVRSYLLGGYSPIFVDDQDTVRFYRFELADVEEEDFTDGDESDN